MNISRSQENQKTSHLKKISYHMRRTARRTSSFTSDVKWNFGAPYLFREWKNIFSTRYLKEDIVSGLTVACIAIPLSLAIALASGVPPAVGLISAIVGGIVCALFGGSALSVSGPAAAMSVLIAANVEQFGLSGLLLIGLLCGLMQLFSGFVGLGALMKYVPLPVIEGFTAGIGAIILVGQLPRALGLPPPDQAHIIEVISHLGRFLHATNLWALGLALLSLALMRLLPKLNKKIPAPLFAIVIPTLLFLVLPTQNVSVIGDIPRSLPFPTLPNFHSVTFFSIFSSAIAVFFLATLETLLSSTAIDKMIKGTKHDPNQELIGQGIGNMAVSLFGGIPVTGVIVRAAVNVKAGAKTRRSAILHALVILACVFVLAPLIKHIPIAALAGILISVAISMLDVKAFVSLFRVSRPDAYIYVITFATILVLDLIAGIQVGFVAAAIIALLQIGKTRVFAHKHSTIHQPSRFSLEGSLSFFSSGKMEDIKRKIELRTTNNPVVIDMGRVTSIDMSGASILAELLSFLKDQGTEVVLKGMNPKHEKLLRANIEGEALPYTAAVSEHDVLKTLIPAFDLRAVRDRLIHGAERFRKDLRHDERELFSQLAQGQDPHTLFVTCSDSRICPSLITSSDPGELFVVRNVGNVIPPYLAAPTPAHAEGAAVEFAVNFLNVKTIVVCGHSACGAVKANMARSQSETEILCSSPLENWLEYVKTDSGNTADTEQVNHSVKQNVLHQVESLRNYPMVKERMASGQLAIFGWFYDLGKREVQEWSEKQQNFQPLLFAKHE